MKLNESKSVVDNIDIGKTKTKPKNVYIVDVSLLNCRKEPDKDAYVVERFDNGVKLTIQDTIVIDGDTWGKCNTGWVNLKYCK